MRSIDLLLTIDGTDSQTEFGDVWRSAQEVLPRGRFSCTKVLSDASQSEMRLSLCQCDRFTAGPRQSLLNRWIGDLSYP